MITYGYPYIPSRYLAPYHRYSGYVLFVVCMASFRQAVRTPPGIITPRTMTKFDNYPYDALLYTDGRVCPTLHMKKLARSKYDRMTNRHVARFDHYCAWLDNTIGEENYRFFLFFVMVQWFMCWYGSSVIFWILKGDVDDKHLFEATFFNAATGEEVAPTLAVVVHWVIHRHTYLSAVLLLLSVMGLVLSGFLSFHSYLIFNNMTTNEYFKWREVQKWHKDITNEYRRSLKYRQQENTTNKKGAVTKTCSETLSFGDKGLLIHRKIVTSVLKDDNTDVGCVGTSAPLGGQNNKDKNTAATTTPASEKADTVANDNNNAKNNDSPNIVVMQDPGPMPKNIYNLGLFENLKEVIFPRSLRQDAMARWHLELMERREEMKNGGESAASKVLDKAKKH